LAFTDWIDDVIEYVAGTIVLKGDLDLNGHRLILTPQQREQLRGPAGTSVKGEKGDRGDPGQKGDPGLPGKDAVETRVIIQGGKGDKGEKGDRGAAGSPGVGIKGDPGVPGAKGDKGDPGKDAELPDVAILAKEAARHVRIDSVRAGAGPWPNGGTLGQVLGVVSTLDSEKVGWLTPVASGGGMTQPQVLKLVSLRG